ncbi:alpha/beta fold hydrolase [Wenxinia saemankumensis]|uniref:Pimeloyl-ACP methyl ester carboxylesterase n=1 Tax=Wenxinia saemankumensis TaxID=1447782 RepID=A0A1M6HHZ8_9RHOB|nr:alpha/beta hydrolase [Wenxinia saemankumensis]SHJ21866.1 Pimeloyl-ACP methyl ester carboxylesterase [Wenxinia saemankumensis]
MGADGWATALAATTLAAAVLTLWIGRAARRRAARVDAAYPPIGRIVDVGGVPVHALVRGTGPDLVLIHGASGNLRDFLPLMDRLEGRYRTIALDRPGLGHSGRPDPRHDGAFSGTAESLRDQVRLLSGAARALGAERPLVLGHSYGGAVALAWAIEAPAAGIVDLSGVAMPWPGGLGWRYRVMRSRLGGAIVPLLVAAGATRAMMAAGVASVLAPNPVPEGYAETVGAELILAPRRWRANGRQLNALRPQVARMAEDYAALTLPIEIVHGRQDSTVPIEIHSIPLAARVASANLTVLEGAGHAPHHSHPDAVIAAIDRLAARAGLR